MKEVLSYLGEDEKQDLKDYESGATPTAHDTIPIFYRLAEARAELALTKDALEGWKAGASYNTKKLSETLADDRLIQFERRIVNPTLNESKRMARELLILRRIVGSTSALQEYSREQAESELIAKGVLKPE